MKETLAVIFSAFIVTASACDSTRSEQSGQSRSIPRQNGVRIIGLNCNPSFDKKTAEERRVYERILEKTGAEVNIVFSDGGAGGPCRSKRAAMLSSGEQLDFAEMSITEAVQAFNEGLILPLNELLDRYGPNLKKNVAPEAFKRATYDGNILGIPIENSLRTLNALQIRTDWLDRLH
jgi:ABC-type glycerol-3-phosphate transport system substrate-binding protein